MISISHLLCLGICIIIMNSLYVSLFFSVTLFFFICCCCCCFVFFYFEHRRWKIGSWQREYCIHTNNIYTIVCIVYKYENEMYIWNRTEWENRLGLQRGVSCYCRIWWITEVHKATCISVIYKYTSCFFLYIHLNACLSI